MRLDQWWSSGSPQWDPWITFSLFCNIGVFVAYELKSIIAVFFSAISETSPPPSPMHCWAGLTSQWLYSSAVGAGNFEKSWSDNDFSLCIVPTPPIWRPTAPHHSSPLPHCFAINTRFFCAHPNMYDHWIAFDCIKFQSVPSKLIILQIYDIHCSTWWCDISEAAVWSTRN